MELGGITPVTASEMKRYLNIMVYGDPGVGKTVLAGSAQEVEEMSPVLFLDCEGGTLSLSKTYPEVDVITVSDWDTLQSIYNDLFEKDVPYKTVVLDSLTEIQQLSMDHIMSAVQAKKPDQEAPRIQDWGTQNRNMKTMVTAFRDLEMHVVFNSLPKTEKDKTVGSIRIRPSLSGNTLPVEVPGFMDILLYMNIRIVEGIPTRVLNSKFTSNTISKDRTGSLPDVIMNPSMKDIYEAWKS